MRARDKRFLKTGDDMRPEVKQRFVQINKGDVPIGYQKTKVGILPVDWKWYTLGDCLQRVEKPVAVQPDKFYTQIGIRSHGKGLFYKEPVTGKSLGSKAVFWIEPNCFILNIVFAWEQAIGKTSQSEVGMIGSHRFPMYRPINDRVDIDYLIYYFLTKRGTDILEAASPGGAGRNRTLGQDRFLKSKIILPSIEEQQKIATILATQDKVIELKEKLLEEKQRQKKYLMQQLLTGKKRLPGFVQKWEKKPFSQVFTFAATNTYSRNNMCQDDSGIKNIHYGDILMKFKEVLKVSDQKIPSLLPSVNEHITTFINDGDIVIADTAEDLTAGKAVEIQETQRKPVVAGLHTMLCKPVKGRFSPGWLGYYMNSEYYHKQLIPYLAGIKVLSISKSNILKTHILVPPLCEQAAITKILFAADHEIELLQLDIEQEKLRKKALMQLLLTGIVRV